MLLPFLYSFDVSVVRNFIAVSTSRRAESRHVCRSIKKSTVQSHRSGERRRRGERMSVNVRGGSSTQADQPEEAVKEEEEEEEVMVSVVFLDFNAELSFAPLSGSGIACLRP